LTVHDVELKVGVSRGEETREGEGKLDCVAGLETAPNEDSSEGDGINEACHKAVSGALKCTPDRIDIGHHVVSP